MLRNLISRHSRCRAALMLLIGVFVLAASASAQGRRFGAGGITVFADPNYRGASATFRTDTPDLRPYQLNDKPSSIDIAPGEVWEVCQDTNYANRCVTLSGSVSDLHSIGWNDRISSLRRVQSGYNRGQSQGTYSYPANAGRLILFDGVGYRGASRTVTSDAGNLGSFGTRVRSVEILGGSWELCDNAAGRGRCITLSRSVPDLSNVGLNGRITSVRPIDQFQNARRNRGNRYFRP